MANALRDAMEVWGTCPKYGEYKAKYLWFRLVSAYDNDKLHVFYDEEKPVGFMTHCFFTEKEAETMKWYGVETFKRDKGDQLWVIDMVANGGKEDVLEVAKHARAYLGKTYPEYKTVYAKRGKRIASYPNVGDWHSKGEA